MESRRRFLRCASFAAVPALLAGQPYGNGNPPHVKDLAGYYINSLDKYDVTHSPDFYPDELVVIGHTTCKLAGHTGDDFVRHLALSFERMRPDPQIAGRYAGDTSKRGIEAYGFAVVSKIAPEKPFSPPYTVKIVSKKVADMTFTTYDPFLTTVSLSELQVIDTFFGFGEELSRLKDVFGGPLPLNRLSHSFSKEFVERLNRMRENFISSKGLGVYPYADMMRHLNEINARDCFGAVGLYALWDDTLTTDGLGKGFEEAVGTVRSLFRSIRKREAALPGTRPATR